MHLLFFVFDNELKGKHFWTFSLGPFEVDFMVCAHYEKWTNLTRLWGSIIWEKVSVRRSKFMKLPFRWISRSRISIRAKKIIARRQASNPGWDEGAQSQSNEGATSPLTKKDSERVNTKVSNMKKRPTWHVNVVKLHKCASSNMKSCHVIMRGKFIWRCTTFCSYKYMNNSIVESI